MAHFLISDLFHLPLTSHIHFVGRSGGLQALGLEYFIYFLLQDLIFLANSCNRSEQWQDEVTTHTGRGQEVSAFQLLVYVTYSLTVWHNYMLIRNWTKACE